MSWQRIDENTYIDDTLVTCAEYQLFIDEMREQGQYCQPDHWISYNFPKGRALEPILGVLRGDAEDFCKWLTGRENSDWNYRLPATEEAKAFLMRPVEIQLVGYWLSDDGWSWVEPNSQKVYEQAIANGENVGIGPIRSLARFGALDIARKIYESLESDLRKIEKPVQQFNNSSLNFDLWLLQFNAVKFKLVDLNDDESLSKYKKVYREVRKFVTEINRIGENYNKDMLLASQAELAGQFIQNAKTKANQLMTILEFISVLSPNLTYRKKFRHVNLLDLAKNIDLSQADELVRDINILQDRLSGRSHAHEGIRLVKERIR